MDKYFSRRQTRLKLVEVFLNNVKKQLNANIFYRINNSMHIFLTYISMLIFFLVVDYVMIIKVINPLFQSSIPDLLKEQANLAAAAFFYLFYVTGIYWFGTLAGIRAGSVIPAILSGSFLGLLAYATYEVTNFSTLKGWTLQMLLLDTLWGGVLGGLTAAVGFYVSRALSN